MDDRAALRVPPNSIEAEHAVLGALLLDNRVFDRVGDLLSPERFYRSEHRAVYQTIAGLIVAGKSADVVTVFEAGGHELAYLNAMAQSVLSISSARDYAQIVVERWRERMLVGIADQLASKAMRCATAGGESVSALIDAAVTNMMRLSGGADEREPIHVGELAIDYVQHIEDVYDGKVVTIPTLLKDLDRITGEGIRDGELWVIGARPSMGKTALTNTLARNMSSQKRASLFMSQEDSLRALMARNVAALGSVNLADLRNPRRAPESMWGGLAEGVERLRQLNMYLDDQTGLGVADVRRKIQQVKRKTDVGVVVVDYLQLMEGSGDNRNIELGRIANGLKRTAKELGTGIILLSQMNREADKRLGPPVVSDLRDSGDIEGAADLIGLLWREHKYRPTEENKFHASLEIAKQKNGPTGTVNLFFDGAFQRFGDWDGPAPSRSFSKRATNSSAARGGMD